MPSERDRREERAEPGRRPLPMEVKRTEGWVVGLLLLFSSGLYTFIHVGNRH